MQVTMSVSDGPSLGTAVGLEQPYSVDLRVLGLRRAVYGGRSDLRADSLEPFLCVGRYAC